MRLHIGVARIAIRLDLPVQRLVRERLRENSVVHPPATSSWLFPSIDPGQPLSAARLGEQLMRLGIEPAGFRRAAKLHLAAGLPAAATTWILDMSTHTEARWISDVGANYRTRPAMQPGSSRRADREARRIDRAPCREAALVATVRTLPGTSSATGASTKELMKRPRVSALIYRRATEDSGAAIAAALSSVV
jgi:hypothetical protein